MTRKSLTPTSASPQLYQPTNLEEIWVVNADGHPQKGTWLLAKVPNRSRDDAALIAEAFDLYRETGFTPRQLLEQRDDLRDALADMLAGWQYIRKHHGDLYGVAWERAEALATYALATCGKVGG